MEREGGGAEDETPMAAASVKPAAAKESELIMACIDAMTGCAQCYMGCTSLLNQCMRCVGDCGGLLRISDKELKSWGYDAEGEQPARYRVSEAEARRLRAEARVARAASKRSSGHHHAVGGAFDGRTQKV